MAPAEAVERNLVRVRVSSGVPRIVLIGEVDDEGLQRRDLVMDFAKIRQSYDLMTIASSRHSICSESRISFLLPSEIGH